MRNITLVTHPLIDHSLTILRDRNTGTEEFRRHAGIVSKILLVEVMKYLATANVKIETPLAPMTVRNLSSPGLVTLVTGILGHRYFQQKTGYNYFQKQSKINDFVLTKYLFITIMLAYVQSTTYTHS